MSIKTPSPLAVERALTTLLTGSYLPAHLHVGHPYTCSLTGDGKCQCGSGVPEAQALQVTVGPDGCVWLKTPGMPQAFRWEPPSRQGAAPYVRNALLVLAEAIRREAAEHTVAD